MPKQKFNLKEAREGLKYILLDKTSAGFGLDEETTNSILNLVKTSDKEFIKRLKNGPRKDTILTIDSLNKFIDELSGKKDKEVKK